MDIFTISSSEGLNATEKHRHTHGPLKAEKSNNSGITGKEEEDSVEISEEGRKKAGESGDSELSEEEKSVLEELKKTDRDVKAHESAHLAAAAGIAVSGASFQYKKGPDGQLYAVGGEVSIDTSEEDTPQATINKAQRIRSAALAPADPSPQDHKVAAQASRMEASARAELAAESREEAEGNGEQSGVNGSKDEEESASGELVDVTA